MPAFRDVGEYGRLASAWVSLLLKRQIVRARQQGLLPLPLSGGQDLFAGAYISDNEIENASFSVLNDGLKPLSELRDEEDTVTQNVTKLTRALRLGLESTRRKQIPLPILTLGERFRCTQEELDLLIAMAAIASDPRLRRIVAYLQNDFSRRRPDTGVLLAALTGLPVSTELPWHLLNPQGTLRWYNLIAVQGGERERATWLMDRPLAMPDAVAAYICRGVCWLDEHIAEFTKVHEPRLAWDELRWDEELLTTTRQRFDMLENQVRQTGQSAGLLLRGAAGAGKKTAALAFCKQHGKRLLVVDARRLPLGEEMALSTLRTLARDARIHNAYLYIENCEVLKGEPASSALRLHALVAFFHHIGDLVLFSTEMEERVDLEQILFIATATISALPVESRTGLWQKILPESVDPRGSKARYLAEQFPISPGVIAQVGADLKAMSAVTSAPPSQRGLARMVLDRSRHNLTASASQVHVRQSWNDIVLAPDIMDRCIRIVQFVRFHSVLSSQWGYGSKLLTSRGVSALFSGPPGAGKTMMAGIIGRELGLDVFRIDVSRILSKWVGETEKNLASLFAEANRTSAVLVFDEADALFSKRTDVKSSADRYSNVEVNYLLQKMESFEGIIILTTNLEKAVDEAFVRRLDFRIRFPEPTIEERREMWRRMLPREVSYGEDVNLDEIAQLFEFTGGYIKKAIIRAGLIAVERGQDARVLYHADLLRAINEEMQEAGRLVSDYEEDHEFG